MRAPKPRIPREEIRTAVLAQLSTSPGPMSRAELDVATGFTPVQVMTLLRELIAAGVIDVAGTGRASAYSIVPGVDLTHVPKPKMQVRVRRGF